MADFIATRPQQTRARDRLGVTTGGTDVRPLPARGFVRFRAVHNISIGLVAELDGPVVPVTGYASHDITARQGREGIAAYAGSEPLSLHIPLRFDRDLERGSIEAELRMLEDLAGLGGKPPRLIIDGFGVTHGHQRDPKRRWELTGGIEWGDDIRHRDDGARTFCQVAVTAQQITAPTAMADPEVDGAGGQGGIVAVRRTYKVPKDGHPRSLKGIAKKFGTTVRHLRALNPKLPKDPDHGLPAGTRVRVY